MYKFSFVLFLVLGLAFNLKAQNVYVSKSGTISFYSDAPLEDIEAVDSKVSSALNFDNGKVYFKVNIADFKFENSLMQEHFNENYMESKTYPDATFSGKLSSSIDPSKNGTYQSKCTGNLKIHGVTKSYTTTVNFIVKDGQVVANTKFNVNLKDHGIKIPSLVAKKIAETVEVKVNMNYVPKK